MATTRNNPAQQRSSHTAGAIGSVQAVTKAERQSKQGVAHTWHADTRKRGGEYRSCVLGRLPRIGNPHDLEVPTRKGHLGGGGRDTLPP